MATNTIRQQAFRGRNDDGSETGATWIAALNANWTQAVGQAFRLRIAADTSSIAVGYVAQAQYRLNGGSWTNVNAASSVVRTALSPNFADDDPTSQQISTFDFYVGTLNESDGLAPSVVIGDGGTEHEWCLQIVSADVTDGDTVEIRSSANGIPLSVYYHTPALTVSKGGAGPTGGPFPRFIRNPRHNVIPGLGG
jgi:hypothetical protein